MNTVLMFVTMGLVYRFKALGDGLRILKFDLLYKYIYINTHKAYKFQNLKLPTALGFRQINTLNLVPLTKESQFPKEQSL